MEKLHPSAWAKFIKLMVALTVLLNDAVMLLFVIGAFDGDMLLISLVNLFVFFPLWVLYTVLVGYLVWNAFPTIYYDSQGIYIYPLPTRIHIPWKSIVNLKKGVLYDIVVCDRITPIHRFYGIFFGFTTRPCVCVT